MSLIDTLIWPFCDPNLDKVYSNIGWSKVVVGNFEFVKSAPVLGLPQKHPQEAFNDNNFIHIQFTLKYNESVALPCVLIP